MEGHQLPFLGVFRNEDHERVVMSQMEYMNILTGILCAILMILGWAVPYGRFGKNWDGAVAVPSKVAWTLIPLPKLMGLAANLYVSGRPDSLAACVLLLLFGIAALYRCVLYPSRIVGGKPFPVLLLIFVLAHSAMNGFLIPRYICEYSNYHKYYLLHPRFLVGMFAFGFGLFVVNWGDRSLCALRKVSWDKGYSVPRGPIFRSTSCPNYLGEVSGLSVFVNVTITVLLTR
eukprot:Nk52_evm55s1810 gene=Nk52_evmTU55s1810